MALVHWLNPINDPFSTATAWSTLTVPGASDDAIIGVLGTYTVTVTAALSVKSLNISNVNTTFVTSGFADHITGNFFNSGKVQVDSQAGGQGGSAVTIGGVLHNSGTFSIGTSSISANSSVTAASLSNSGTLNLIGNVAGGFKATLDITGTAGFGSAGLLTGVVNLSSNALLEFGSGQITKIAAGAQLNLRGTARLADAGKITTNSALTGLAKNAGTLLIGGGETVVTTGAFANTGSLRVDNESGVQGNSSVTFGGALTNTGTIAIGLNTNSLGGAAKVKAAGLNNAKAGIISLAGTFGSAPTQIQATLQIAGVAGFGTAGVLSGAVNLIGDTLLEFGGGQITSIAVGGKLDLRGNARLANGSDTTSNSALKGLTNNSGTLLIGDGATVQTTTTAALLNSGSIGIDSELTGQGGSALLLGGSLTNSGTFSVGYVNNSLGADTAVTVKGLKNSGTINLYGNLTGSAPGPFQASLAVAGAAGFGTAGVLTGKVNLIGDTLLKFASGQITNIALGGKLDLRGNARLANASDLTTNSALTTLATNTGALLLGDGAVVTTTTTLANTGTLQVDDENSKQGGSSLTIGGALINVGTTSIGPKDNTLSSGAGVRVASLSNTGTVNLYGNFPTNTPGDSQASLIVGGAASFGNAGVVTGSVNLIGDSLLQFASGQITKIATDAELTLRGNARLADASNATTNSALTAFVNNAGSFFIGDGAVVNTATTKALANSGLISVDSQLNNQGGSALNLGGALINSGTVSIGYNNNSLGANTTVTAKSLINTGTVNIWGTLVPENKATLSIASAAGFGAAGVLSGTVYLSGDALLQFASGQITRIASGGALTLRRLARIADASDISSSSALTGLLSNAGALMLGDNEVVTSTAAANFTNTGTIGLDNQVSAQGGSDLHLARTLVNSNTITIGSTTLSGNDFITANGLNNLGTISLTGNLAEGSFASLDITGTATNSGGITLNSGGVVSVNGSFVSTTGGVTTVQSGATLTATSLTIKDGALQGNGTVSGPLTLAAFGDLAGGVINGVTPGTLNVNGPLNVIGGVVHELVKGTTAGLFSRINMTTSNSINLDGGAVEVDATGFSLAAGQTYTVASFTPGELTGVFKTVLVGQAAADGSAVDLGNGLTVGLVYGENAGVVQLRVVATPVTTADHWLGGTADLTSAANWDQGAPTFYSDLVVGNTAGGHVTASTDATINSLSLLSGNTLTTNAGATLSIGATAAVSSGATLTALGDIATGGGLTDGGNVVIGSGTAGGQLTVEGALNGAGAMFIKAHALLLAEGGGTFTGALTNNGTLTANGPRLALEGAVAGSGTLQINANSEIELGGASANTVLFNGAGATLKLDTPANFTGVLSHLDLGDVLDLGATNATSATVSGGTLQVGLQGGGLESFNLANFTGGAFTLTHVGADTLLTDIGPSTLTASADAFNAIMAAPGSTRYF